MVLSPRLDVESSDQTLASAEPPASAIDNNEGAPTSRRGDAQRLMRDSRLRRRSRSGIPASVGYVLSYCVLAVVAYGTVSPLSASRIMNCGCHDAAQEAWFLAWPRFALTHLHNPFYSNWIAYPHGVNLATNASMQLLGVLSAPIVALAGPVSAYNFVLRLAFAASATSAFFVLRRWTPWEPAAYIGGLIYGFSPYMVGEGLGHAFLMFTPIPPLMFLAAVELFVTQRRPAWQAGAVVGALAVLQYYIASEILATTVVLAAVATCFVGLARPALVRGRIRHALTGLAYAGAVFLVIAGPAIWYSFEGAQHIVGPPHSVASLAPYHADLLSAIVPSHSERIAPFGLAAVGDRLTGYDITETGAYLGIPLLILLVVFAVRYRRDPRIRLASAMAVVSYVLSMGAYLDIDGSQTHIPLPFLVLQHLPLIDDAVAGRFSLYTNFFVAALVAIGLGLLRTERAREPGRRRGWLATALGKASWRGSRSVACLALALVCLLPLLPSFPYPEAPTGVPRFFTSASVNQIPADSVMLAYPYPYTPNDQAMLWSGVAGLRFKIIGGQVAIPGANGQTSSAPEQLTPLTTEELFLSALLGSASPLPQPPPPGRQTLSDIRAFLINYHVRTIVADPIGHDPDLIVRYVDGALNETPRDEGGVELWPVALRSGEPPSGDRADSCGCVRIKRRMRDAPEREAARVPAIRRKRVSETLTTL